MRHSTVKRFFSSFSRKGHFIPGRLLLPLLAVLLSVRAFAAGDGSAGIVQATQMVTGYFDPATKLIYAAGAPS